MRSKTYIVLLLLVLLNIAVRIPVTPHEIGHDSFFIHWMAQSIMEEGTALWLVHPASVFGLYPYSYPSFVPFLLLTERKGEIYKIIRRYLPK